MLKMQNAFVVALVYEHVWAMTTRPDGREGLPGGKVEQGEEPWQAVLREAAEEGWLVELDSHEPIQVREVAGRETFWFAAKVIAQLSEYKEKQRGIVPVRRSGAHVRASGWGNDTLPI